MLENVAYDLPLFLVCVFALVCTRFCLVNIYSELPVDAIFMQVEQNLMFDFYEEMALYEQLVYEQ